MNRIFLVRHGENLANLTKEFSYRKIDYPLTPKGRLQAHQTANFFVGQPARAVYCSPLRRAHETAEIIAARLKLPLTVIEDFREVNVGALEGAQDLEAAWVLHMQIIDAWFRGELHASFPQGEDLASLIRRLRAGLQTAVSAHPDQTLIVVGHGGLFTLGLPHLCADQQGVGLPADALRSQENHNCSISEIQLELRQPEWRAELISWGNCAHLQGEAAALVSGLPQADSFRRKP